MRPVSRRFGVILPAMLFLTVCALPALADITLGGDARAVAMGGAGLASGDNQAVGMNPATLADTGMRFAIQWPSVDARMQGASYLDTLKLIGNPSLKPKDAIDYAIDLGSKDIRLDASATAGLLLPKMDLQVKAAIRTEIKPNDAFKAWAKSGGTGTAPTDASADVYAGGLATLPSLGVGFHLPVDADTTGKIAIGVRLKPTTAYYSHYVIDSDAITAHTPKLAAEMGGNDYLKQGSFSADLGIQYTPAKAPNAHFALVVNNLVEPQPIQLSSTAPNDLYARQLAPRSISAGAAIVNDRVTLAADLVDITGAYGTPQIRVGSELRLPGNLLAIRGGYNTATGFTAGIGIGGFGIAFSKSTPIMLSQSITF